MKGIAIVYYSTNLLIYLKGKIVTSKIFGVIKWEIKGITTTFWMRTTINRDLYQHGQWKLLPQLNWICITSFLAATGKNTYPSIFQASVHKKGLL